MFGIIATIITIILMAFLALHTLSNSGTNTSPAQNVIPQAKNSVQQDTKQLLDEQNRYKNTLNQ